MENKEVIKDDLKEVLKPQITRKQYQKALIKYIGQQIINISIEHGISLDDICQECNVPQKFIKLWIAGKGKLYLYMLCRICLKYNKKLIIHIEDMPK